MSDVQTTSPDQLPILATIPEDWHAVGASPEGPLQRLPFDRLLARLIKADLVKVDTAALAGDLAHAEHSVALVHSDPDPLKNGWWRKVGASGAGEWVQFETLARTALTETARNAAVAAAAALQLSAMARADSYNQYYVSATGTGTGDGSRANPWTWAQASANSGANPAGLAFPACINIDAGTYLNVNSNVRVTGQTATAPIVFRGTPGQAKPVFRSSLALTWTRVINEAGRQVYASNEVFSAGGNIEFGGFIKLNGQWYPLPRVTRARLESTNGQSFRVDGEFYPGPCVSWDSPSGKYYLRLDPPTYAAQLGAQRSFAATVSTDPADYEIMIDNGQNGLKPFSGHMKFYNIRFENHYQSIGMNAAGGPFEGLEFYGVDMMPSYRGVNLGRMKNVRFHGCLLDGRMTRDWWISYWDIKGGATIAERTRKVAVESAGPGASFTDGADFTGSTIIGFFDGHLGGGHNVRFGGYDPFDPNNDLKAWAFANYIDCWDDAAQLLSQNQGFKATHNIVPGAGFSRDGATSSTNQGDNPPLVYRNVIWPQQLLFYGRQGAIDGDGIQIREGLAYPAAMSSHGLRSGAGDWRHPWHYISNTVIVRWPNTVTGPAAVGARGMDLVLGMTAAGNYGGGRNLLLNNLLVMDEGFAEFRAAAVAAGHPGNFWLWLSQDLRLGRGDEIIDGNAVVGFCGNILSVAEGSVKDTFHIRNVRNAAGTLLGERLTFGEMAANPAMLALMQTNYGAAYQQAGVDLPDVTRAADVVNQLTYQPLASTGLSAGGIDPTIMAPGVPVFHPGRGAKA